MVVVEDIGVFHILVHFPVVPQQVQKVCRLVTDGKQLVSVFGEEFRQLFQSSNLKTRVLCEHSSFKRAVFVELEMVNDSFHQCPAFIIRTFLVEENEIVILLVTNARLTLNMQ